MDQRGAKSKYDNGDDNSSFGILNMDNCRVFGEVSSNSSNNSRASGKSREVNERLHAERSKANEMLNKSNKQRNLFLRPESSENKENIKAATDALNRSSNLNHTDYVPFSRNTNSNNVSDFVIDHSIPLELSDATSNPPSAVKNDMKISFVPAEFTGRSTCAASLQLSVGEILASSFAPRARNLCETLQHNGDITLESIPNIGTTATTAGTRISSTASSSSFTSYNASHSLPRTADMSRTKASCSELSFNGCSGASGFSFTAGAQRSRGINDSNLNSGEEFSPSELMQSQLAQDEIAWADQYAAIPTAALSEQAKALAARTSGFTSNGFDSQLVSNSMIANDPNFSVGNFFNMRSENLWNIVSRSKSPQKFHTPVALVDDPRDDSVSTTTSATPGIDLNSILNTPQVDNRTYSIVSGQSVNKQTTEERESKNSANATQNNSNLLSLSAIDRALYKLDMRTDESEAAVNEQLKLHARPKSTQLKSSDRQHVDVIKECELDVPQATAQTNTSAEKMNKDLYTSLVELISENKENLDPQALCNGGTSHQLSDTISFTESLLNSSIMQQIQQQRSPPDQPRSPLSPLVIQGMTLKPPIIKISTHNSEADEEVNHADIDEFPSTPVKSPNRRVRRTKSPVQKSLFKSDATETSPDTPKQTTPVNKQQSRSPANLSAGNAAAAVRNKKSLCSTRLDNGSHCDFGISPNLSTKSVAQIRNNNNNSNEATLTAVAINNGSSFKNSPAAASFDCSPFSSPHSCLASNTTSPSGSYNSPHMDRTTNSERRFLNAGLLQKSPLASESGISSKYGAPSRSCSATSMRSNGYATTSSANTGRSISRCSSSHSNSSEFSHRDGKTIPLKITAMELCWGTTKLRTEAVKSLQVKNSSPKRLVVRIEIHGPGFQISNTALCSTLTLQSQECRTIIVNFCPTVLGAACGTLSFSAPHSNNTATTTANQNTPFLVVPLYGYGGHTYITLQQIQRGPVGTPFLSMGDLSELANGGDQLLQRTFTIHNKGVLMGFALACIDSVGLTMPRLCDAFIVEPQALLIPPGGMATVRVTFRPRREDMKKILKRISTVLTLANLRITCGDEANRQRIRRLVARMSPEDRTKIASSKLDHLWLSFPKEVEMYELAQFKEPTSVTMDLLCSMRVHEIALTLNYERLDESKAETSSLYFSNADETVLFRTICCGGGVSPTPGLASVEEEEYYEDRTSMLSPAAVAEDERAVSSSTREPASTDSWSVSPKSLNFNLNRISPAKEVKLFVRNFFKSRQYFEVFCTHKDCLTFTPSEGYIESEGGQVEIKVHVSEHIEQQLSINERLKVMVYMENDRKSLPVSFSRNN